MGLNEPDTRAKLIDPALHARGWTEDLIRREETAGAVQIIAGNPRCQARGLGSDSDTALHRKDQMTVNSASKPWIGLRA